MEDEPTKEKEPAVLKSGAMIIQGEQKAQRPGVLSHQKSCASCLLPPSEPRLWPGVLWALAESCFCPVPFTDLWVIQGALAAILGASGPCRHTPAACGAAPFTGPWVIQGPWLASWGPRAPAPAATPRQPAVQGLAWEGGGGYLRMAGPQ